MGFARLRLAAPSRATLRIVRRLAAALTILLIAPAAEASPPEAAGDRDGWFSFDTGWDDGITYEYRQRIPGLAELGGFAGIEGPEAEEPEEPHAPFHLKGRIGGSLYLDGGRLRGGALDDGLRGALRRARLYTRGDFGYWITTEYKFEFAIEKNRFFLNDFYLRWRPQRWVDTVKFGYFDPPTSLQALGSSSGRALMEVAAPVAAFAPGFRLGLEAAARLEDPSLTWSLSLSSLGQKQTIGNASSDPLRVIGRVVWRPWGPERDGAPLLHLGGSASFSFSGRGSIRFRARPESFLAPYLVDTGDVQGEVGILAVEAAWRDGPLSLQGEGFYAALDARSSGVHNLWGVYAQASCVITGESRSYDSGAAVVGRVRPKADFAPWRGAWGAVELTARASWVDLSDGSLDGGRMVTLNVGPAWTLNRWVRLLAGYVYANGSGGPDEGGARILQLRLELVL